MKLDVQVFFILVRSESIVAPSLYCCVCLCAAQGFYTAEDVKAIAETAVQQAEEEKEKVHKMLIKRPNDKWMIRDYMRSQTVYYKRDFNTDMLVRKRQRDERQAELDKQQIIDVLPFTSLLASVDDGGSDLQL